VLLSKPELELPGRGQEILTEILCNLIGNQGSSRLQPFRNPCILPLTALSIGAWVATG
jgi:hypothetical protein